MKRDAKKGDKETAINLKVHFGHPMIYNDEVILAGEVYYADYHTEIITTTTKNQQGQVLSRKVDTRRIFDGYVFTNILFAAFDMSGKMLWSNSLPYTRPRAFSIYDRIRTVLQDDGSVMVVYNDGVNIKNAIVNKDNVIQGTRAVSIGGSITGDKVKEAADFDVVYWYDDFYLASGLQKIKNKELKGKDRKRNIFYMKKVKFDY
jgi:hypothetical protein